MSEHDAGEPLDDLRALLDAERAFPSAPYEAARAEVFARVEATMLVLGPQAPGATAPGPAAAPPEASTLARLATGKVTLAIAAFIAGGGVVATAQSLRQPAPSAVVEPTRAPAVPPPPSVVAAAPASTTSEATDRRPPEPSAAASPAASRAPAPSAAPEPSGSASARRTSLAAERELLDVARAALGRGRPGDAIAALDQHARAFPAGALSEEREVMAIQALVRSGRAGEARARAERFRAAYPRSVMLPAVEAAVRANP